MSSQTQTVPGILLNQSPFDFVNAGLRTISEWFKAWEFAKKRKDTQGLLTLLHLGLRLPLHQQKGEELNKLFAFYLSVADGHSKAENFGFVPNRDLSPYQETSPAEVKQKLADEAWMGLCNKVFSDSDPDYLDHFFEPELCDAFIRFIEPNRWWQEKWFAYDSINIPTGGKTAYEQKAQRFVKRFLRGAWDFRQSKMSDPTLQERLPDTWKSDTRRDAHLWKLRPKLIELMSFYGILEYLFDRPLNRPCRRVLLDIAVGGHTFGNPRAKNTDLTKLYGQYRGASGCFEIGNRTAARILVLYPLLVLGEREFKRAKMRYRLQEKVEKNTKIQEKIAELSAQLI